MSKELKKRNAALDEATQIAQETGQYNINDELDAKIFSQLVRLKNGFDTVETCKLALIEIVQTHEWMPIKSAPKDGGAGT